MRRTVLNYRKRSHAVYDIKYHLCVDNEIQRYEALVEKEDAALCCGELLRQTAKDKNITWEVFNDHVYMLLLCPTNLSP